MKAKTKRRKVWVSAKFGGGTKLFDRLKEAKAFNPAFEPVKLVESRPGDVVLSREDADRLRAAAREHLGPGVVSLTLDLLRGGR